MKPFYDQFLLTYVAVVEATPLLKKRNYSESDSIISLLPFFKIINCITVLILQYFPFS